MNIFDKLDVKQTVIVALVLIIINTVIVTIAVRTRGAEKFEYTIVTTDDLSFDMEMERRGNTGWEMIFARRALNDGRGCYEMIFKRIKQ